MIAQRDLKPISERMLRGLVTTLYYHDPCRHVVVDELKECIKSQNPGVDKIPFDLPLNDDLGFENLMGLFASTSLDELIITMNVRQSAYLFGLIRRMGAKKIIEIGRQRGGSTLLIAVAMRGKGEFWSIDDPSRLDYDIKGSGQKLDRPVEDQVADICGQLGLKVCVIAGDSRVVEINTGEVDLVFIDGDHSYEWAMSDFQRFGMRVRVGGALLLDDAVYDDFSEPKHTADVKRVVKYIEQRGDFRQVKTVKRMVHFERFSGH